MINIRFRFGLLSSILLVAFVVSVATAQISPAVDAKDGKPEPVTVKIDTGDSPVQITRTTPWLRGGQMIGSKKAFDENNAGYTMSTVDDKKIRAYALALTHLGRIDVQLLILSGALRDADQKHLYTYVFDKADEPAWAFDWVLFDDGTTWGPDKYGASKRISEFLRGKDKAIERATEWIGSSDSHPLRNVMNPSGLRSSGYNVAAVARREQQPETYDFDQGYESVINSLMNHMGQKTRELSKQIAERLREQLQQDRRAK